MNFLWLKPKPAPLPVRIIRTAPRAQRRSRAEQDAFEATTSKLRAQVARQREIEVAAYSAVARGLGV